MLAHRAAEERMARGAPVILVMPGGVYGPGDSSDLGQLIDRVRRGRLPGRMYPETGFNWVHVDDVVDGILLAHDRSRIGERYVLGGHLGTMGDMIDAVAAAKLIAAADGVTYWASHEKARRELGYRPRDLRTGVSETVKALS